jgi:hypothetical protein
LGRLVAGISSPAGQSAIPSTDWVRGHLDIEDALIFGGHAAGPLEQDPQLRIGMG